MGRVTPEGTAVAVVAATVDAGEVVRGVVRVERTVEPQRNVHGCPRVDALGVEGVHVSGRLGGKGLERIGVGHETRLVEESISVNSLCQIV